MRKPKKEIEYKVIENVEITSITPEDKAMGKHDGKVIFVDNAVPGDIVDIKIYKSKKNFAKGSAINFHQYSSIRSKPHCQHFGLCGGCKWQDLQYTSQLIFKHQIVKEAFEHIGKLENLPEILPTLASPKTEFYRNKLQFAFSNKGVVYDETFYNKMRFVEQPSAGFHVQGQFQRVLDLENCWHMPEPSNKIRMVVRDFAIQNNIAFHSILLHEGLMREVTIRMSSLGEIMVIVGFYYEDEFNEKLLQHLLKEVPEITTLLYVINHKMNDYSSDLPHHIFSGKGFIMEQLGNVKYKISPQSFFQTNSYQAKNLYDIVKDFAGLTGSENVFDLYTGTGSIALYLSDAANTITGIEYIESAIEDAHENAAINDIKNCNFLCGDMAKTFTPQFIASHGKPDVIITDPPRAGMHPDVVEMINNIAAPKVVYVSCNPTTQARDLQILSNVYSIKKIQPVDMFPHTTHVECVVLLEKK
jgi:23S rRNA (uracil1939-C5)-methyltransferase